MTLSQDESWIEVTERPFGKKRRWGVELDVTYSKPGGSLAPLPLTYKIERDPQNPSLYHVFVPLTGKITRFNLVAVLPTGKVEQEEAFVYCPNWESLAKLSSMALNQRKFYMGTEQTTVSLGYTSLVYQETGVDPIAASLLTIKGGVSGSARKVFKNNLQWLSRWGWGLLGYATLVPLNISLANTSMRFLGFNVRATYAAPVPAPWSLRISTGYYYTTMMVSAPEDTGRFGFQNQMGPQIMPAVARSIGTRHAVAAYFKAASIPDGLNVLDFTSRELAFGLSYSFVIKRGLAASVAYDQAWLKTIIQGSAIQSDTQSFSIGVNFSGE